MLYDYITIPDADPPSAVVPLQGDRRNLPTFAREFERVAPQVVIDMVAYTERGHKVIDTGPYAIVRHPGYVAGRLFSVGTALCLGSVWALIPAGLASAFLILRTQWED
jgi:protein-S-isoprenylcysteine O-methyltransferase Ste14